MSVYKQLDAREQRFVEEYLIDLDPKRAAIAAGYAKSTANSKAFTWVSESKPAKPHLFQALQDAKRQRARKTKVDAERVLTRLAEIDDMDISEILNDDLSVKPLSEWSKTWRKTISGVDVKEIIDMNNGVPTMASLKRIKWPDKLRTIELMARHVDVKAFQDTVQHQHGMDEKTTRTLKEIFAGARRKEIKH